MRVLRPLRRFHRDETAVVSLEFILTLPLLALWMIGSFVFFDAYRSLSQTEKIAYTISDMVSRYEEVDDTDLNNLWVLQQKIQPPRLTHTWMRITSICKVDDIFVVQWSYARSDDDVVVAELTTETIPESIMPHMVEQDSVILTEVHGRWTPLSTSVGMRVQTWENELVVRPRFVRMLPHETRNDGTLCVNPYEDDDGGGGVADDNGDGGDLGQGEFDPDDVFDD